MSKVDRIRADQSARAAALEAEADDLTGKATMIEYNLDLVDAALDAVNSALAGGMDWPSLQKLIKDERRAGNPVASLIHSLDLANNSATLILGNLLDDEDEADDDGALKNGCESVY